MCLCDNYAETDILPTFISDNNIATDDYNARCYEPTRYYSLHLQHHHLDKHGSAAVPMFRNLLLHVVGDRVLVSSYIANNFSEKFEAASDKYKYSSSLPVLACVRCIVRF